MVGIGGATDPLSPTGESPCEEPANCHAGIDGRPTRFGKEGVGEGEKEGPWFKRSAFSDFNSCCSSPSDCVCASLFRSII